MSQKLWSVVLLNKKYTYSYLKCIVYDKLLKPRQSFWITLYMCIYIQKSPAIQKHIMNILTL